MKSNGLAKKIHVSEQAYKELQKTNTFDIKFRGIVTLKNRGDMKVYSFFRLLVIKLFSATGWKASIQLKHQMDCCLASNK